LELVGTEALAALTLLQLGELLDQTRHSMPRHHQAAVVVEQVTKLD
jgi:hypothetical protein